MHPCHGVFNEQLRSMVNIPGHYGSLSSQHFLIASQIEAARNQEICSFETHYELEMAYPSEVAELEALIKHIPLYHSTTQALRSTVCVGFSSGSEPKPCACCEAILHDLSVQRRMRRAAVSSGSSKFTRHDQIAAHCLLQRMRVSSVGNRDLWFAASSAIKSSQAARRSADRAELKLMSSTAHDNAPKHLRSLVEAHNDGIIPPSVMQEMISDMGKSVVCDGHQRSKTVRSFYVTLLNCGNPWICEFVSQNLNGPCLRTIKSWRSDTFFTFHAGRVIQNLSKLAEMLKEYNLLDVPGMWSEDATTCLKKIVTCLKENPDGIEVMVEGFTEPLMIRSVTELNDAFDKYQAAGLATYVYVWTWIPQLPHAPYFPVIWIASNNRFDAGFVWDWWLWLHKEGRVLGLKSIGYVSDGDSRLRKADYEMNLHNSDGVQTRSIDHPLIWLHMSILDGVPLMGYQDWMHASAFRCRKLFIDLNHNFHLADGAAAGAKDLQCFNPGHFNDTDLDHHEKQHYSGCLKLAAPATIKLLSDHVASDPAKEKRGALAYCIFMCKLLNCSIGPQGGAEATDRSQAVRDAAFACSFVLYWRWQIINMKDKGYSILKHFLT